MLLSLISYSGFMLLVKNADCPRCPVSVSEATEYQRLLQNPSLSYLLSWPILICGLSAYLTWIIWNRTEDARSILLHHCNIYILTHWLIATYYLANFQSHYWFFIREWSSVGKGDPSSIWFRKLNFHFLPSTFLPWWSQNFRQMRNSVSSLQSWAPMRKPTFSSFVWASYLCLDHIWRKEGRKVRRDETLLWLF